MIAVDKKLHFIVCFAISLFLYPIIGWWSPCVAIVAGIGKEIYDYKDYGNFSWSDILADIIGVLAGFGIILIIKLLIS